MSIVMPLPIVRKGKKRDENLPLFKNVHLSSWIKFPFSDNALKYPGVTTLNFL